MYQKWLKAVRFSKPWTRGHRIVFSRRILTWLKARDSADLRVRLTARIVWGIVDQVAIFSRRVEADAAWLVTAFPRLRECGNNFGQVFLLLSFFVLSAEPRSLFVTGARLHASHESATISVPTSIVPSSWYRRALATSDNIAVYVHANRDDNVRDGRPQY